MRTAGKVRCFSSLLSFPFFSPLHLLIFRVPGLMCPAHPFIQFTSHDSFVRARTWSQALGLHKNSSVMSSTQPP